MENKEQTKQVSVSEQKYNKSAIIGLVLSIISVIGVGLAGIAGFILSAGAAAEASVLVLERIREEIRKGKSVELAIDNGFKGAWPSIKDSNLQNEGLFKQI